MEEFKKYNGVPWIMKPIGKAQGRGIFMFTKLKDIAKWKTEFRWKPGKYLNKDTKYIWN